MKTYTDIIKRSASAVSLANERAPKVVEHRELQSTANSDIKTNTINLNISQPPLKIALSYCYELMNMRNKPKYQNLIGKAARRDINKSSFVSEVLKLESDAILFRSKVFSEMNLPESEFPCSKIFLEIYKKTKNKGENHGLSETYNHIKENSLVRKQFSTKRYYLDMYKHYAKQASWPEMYNAKVNLNAIPVSGDGQLQAWDSGYKQKAYSN